MATSRTPVSKPATTKKTTATASAALPASTAKAAPKARAKAATATPATAPVTRPKPPKLTPDASATSKPRASKKAPAKKTVAPEERYQMVVTAAYFLAERHGFSSGRAMDDWIAAEKEIDALLNSES